MQGTRQGAQPGFWRRAWIHLGQFAEAAEMTETEHLAVRLTELERKIFERQARVHPKMVD